HLLRFHHALALRGLSRGIEARPLFGRVYSEGRGLPVSVASVRQAVLCSLDQAHAKQITGTAAFSSARNPNERQAATRAIHEARNEIHRAGEELQNRAAQLRSAFPDAIMRARMFYDAAWCFRDLMEAEVQESWEQLRQQVARQEAEELLRFLPPRTRLPAWPLPQVSRQDLPLQPSERRAQAAYQSLIDEFPIEAIGVAARLELAELQVLRADPAAAVPLLQAAREALTPTHPVPARLREQVHMRLGGCLMGLGQYDSAFRQYHTVVHDPESYDTVLARMYASECLIHMGKPAEAAELLAPARTVARGVLAEAVLLRHAQAQLQAFQWREADLGFEQFLAQCGNEHPFAWAARYGRACVDQNQQRFAEARAGYRPIVEHAVGPLAAQAQIRLGQCWLAEGKAAEAIAELLVAATRQPDSAEAHVAVLEAARACLTAEKPQQAELLLTRLLADVPVASDWARAARERLDLLVRE
ncbi:MAG: tetratricopeptide repeat protein, partial [Bacteroidales bacterium]|nr:tetratricopeptide repeat protein [Bacteroidales bacterium]